MSKIVLPKNGSYMRSGVKRRKADKKICGSEAMIDGFEARIDLYFALMIQTGKWKMESFLIPFFQILIFASPHLIRNLEWKIIPFFHLGKMDSEMGCDFIPFSEWWNNWNSTHAKNGKTFWTQNIQPCSYAVYFERRWIDERMKQFKIAILDVNRWIFVYPLTDAWFSSC